MCPSTAWLSQVDEGQYTSSSSSSSPDDVMTAADVRPSPVGDEAATDTVAFSSRPNQLALQPASERIIGLKSRDIGCYKMEEETCAVISEFNHSLKQTTLRVQPLLIPYPVVHQLAPTPPESFCRPSVLLEESDLLHNDWQTGSHLHNLTGESRRKGYWRYNINSQKCGPQRQTTASSTTSRPMERSCDVPDGCVSRNFRANEEQVTSSLFNLTPSPVFQPTRMFAITMASCRKYRFSASDSYGNEAVARQLLELSSPSSTSDESLMWTRRRGPGQEHVAQSEEFTTPSPTKKLSVSCVVSELVNLVQRVRRMRMTSSTPTHVATPMTTAAPETSV